MIVPLHLGFEHPDLVWLGGVGLLAFVAGLGVNLYRSSDRHSTDIDSMDSEDELSR